MPVVKVTKSKRIVINMGNYESYATEVSVDIPLDDPNPGLEREYLEALEMADRIINASLIEEVEEAARVSDVRNTYVLTWLKNRKEELKSG